MFDIDNTLAYTGFKGTDLVGKAPVLTAAVEFVNRWCAFDDSDSPFECFFFTARYCTSLKAAATKIWVTDNFAVSHEWIDKHVFMTGHRSAVNAETNCRQAVHLPLISLHINTSIQLY